MPSQTINLNQAIYEITDALSERDNPFYFIVGAGISYDSVPLARDIIEMCKDKLKKNNLGININEELNGADEYSFWLDKAYPQLISRQRFFRELIENKNITPANFRLAHLLAYGKLGNIVVTPNFDDFLTRALNHFNVKHIICDHQETAFKVNSEIKDIQIVHVHGTYLSYDICNLTPEIIERNRGSEISTNTMASLLERIGESISPIVVGYSGWENDVIMTSLRKRLHSRRLPYKLYWFCYSTDQLNNMPEWLVNHNDVAFVIPEKNAISSHNSINEISEINEPFSIDSHNKISIKNETKLSAHFVFDSLVNALDLPEPEITADPINFLIKFIGGTMVDEKSKDVFFLDQVIKRLKNLKKLEEQNDGKDDQNLSLFKNIRGFARRSQYVTAARLLQELDYNNFEKVTLLELMEVILSILMNSETKVWDEKYELTLTTFNYLEDVVEKVKSHDEDSEVELNELLILAYDFKCSILKELDDDENFLLTLDKIIELFSEKMQTKLHHSYVRAKYHKALSFIDRDTSIATTLFETIIREFEKEDDKRIREFVMLSALKLVPIYAEIADYPNAHKYADYVLKHSDSFGENAETMGYFYKMSVFNAEEKEDEALAILQHLELNYSDKADDYIAELLIEAIMYIEGQDADAETSLALNNKIIGLFRDSKSKKVQKQVSEAYFNKAFYFYKKGDNLTAADNFIKAFELGFTLAGVNVFYLFRKRLVQVNMLQYTMEELITPKLKEDHAFALVNQAMYLIQRENNWIDADKLMLKFRFSSKAKINLEEVKEWWYGLSRAGDDEGDLVLAWLQRYSLIKDPDNLNIKERLKRVISWEIPQFMFDYVEEKTSELQLVDKEQ